MCGRYQRRSDKQKIAEAFQFGNIDGLHLELAPDYNVAPQAMQPVIVRDEQFGIRTLQMMFWRFLPPFVAVPKKFNMTTINVLMRRVIHIICDNYATHKPAAVQRWLGKHKRFHLHFRPTSASWLNMVERFFRDFRDLTVNRIRRGIFPDLEQLILAIGDYIDRHNENPKPIIWTAKANDILEKVTRAQAALFKRLSV
jgi:transposase